ncbi:MAG: hypothetical protein GY827_04510 [Cytophagales bacterium]|nr:hypothetical protein [Cytophagales bacterium]
MELDLKKIKDYVRADFEKYSDPQYSNIVVLLICQEPDRIEHIIDIGASILMTKYPELGGYPGGSFVQSVVDNNLSGAIGSADATNKLALDFYMKLLYNFSLYNYENS